MTHEGLGQGELPGGELHGSPLQHQSAGAQVQNHVAMCQTHLVGAGGIRAQPYPNTGQQLLKGEGLGHVVVRAALQTGDAVGHRGARREHDDRCSHSLAAQLLEHLEAVDVGQAHIQDDEVEVLLDRQGHGLPALGGGVRGEPGRLETLGEEGDDAGLVLNDEDAAHGE